VKTPPDDGPIKVPLKLCLNTASLKPQRNAVTGQETRHEGHALKGDQRFHFCLTNPFGDLARLGWSASLPRKMEVNTKTRVATSLRKGDIGMKDFSTFGVAKSALTMYVERPHDELTLADFEVAALDRLTGAGVRRKFRVFRPVF
jgi:hypothetical protein